MVCEDFNVYLESEEEERKKTHTLVWNAIYNLQDMKGYIYIYENKTTTSLDIFY